MSNDNNDFSILDELNGLKLNGINGLRITTSSIPHDDEICTHLNCFQDDKGKTICIECGIEVFENISFDKEWRYYGASDTKNGGSDPNRCQIRKSEERNIYDDIKHMGFSLSIQQAANTIYRKVTEGQIFRGDSRKAIIFACIFKAFKETGCAQSFEHLQNVFGLKRKVISGGMKRVGMSSKSTVYITPADLVPEIMRKFNAEQDHINHVEKLYVKIRNRSSLLNRSRPQSVAAGLVFYYCSSIGKNIPSKVFAEKVGLSELTINKINKEIKSILGELKI